LLLFTRQLASDTRFGAWHIAEAESFFREDLPLTEGEAAELARHLDPIRRLEWLASRWLLHRMTGAPERMPLQKNPFAKPFFTEETDLQCSLSHSQGTVAALLSNTACGCDIQVLVDKMPRIAPRFMRADEFDMIRSYPLAEQFVLLHAFWTAKEALYKAYGLKELDFRAHLHITPFTWQNNIARTTGWVEKNDIMQSYQLYIELFQTEAPQKSFVWTVAELTESIEH
jgi:4'-phosphopantetheinyl transferase